MDRFKERMKQKFMGASESHSQPPPSPAFSGSHGHGNAQQHADAHKILFETLPDPPPSPSPSTPCTKPVKIASVTWLGDVRSLTTNMVRDLGFTGHLGPYTLLTYGDTLYTNSDLKAPNFMGMTSNSVALATHNPLAVLDVNLDPSNHNWPTQFVPVHAEWGETMSDYAVGITNIVETDPSTRTGILFTLLNHRPGGVQRIVGAGLATITLDFCRPDGIPVPRARRISPHIWDGETEPWWGDLGAIKAGGHIYAYGHMKDNPWVYVARVPTEQVLNVDAYEYWHGAARGWCRDRLRGDAWGEEQSVFWQVNQGQVCWNPYFNQFLFVYCDRWWNSTLLIKSAPAPEGPWSDVVNVHKCPPITEGGTVYSPAPHPYLDPSGKTLVIGFTNHPNCIQAVRVEFE